MSRSLPTTTKAISYWCGFSTIETMGSLQLVPKTPTTRKAETDSNQSTTIHERIPSSNGLCTLKYNDSSLSFIQVR